MKLDRKEAYAGGYGRKFTFGKHPDDTDGTENNPSNYSSCMTSEKGPSNSWFKYCDTKQVSYNS